MKLILKFKFYSLVIKGLIILVHEWALAEALIRYVKELSKERGVNRVSKLVIKLGILQSIDRNVLEFSIMELAKINNLIIESLVFEDEDAILKCRACGYEWSLDMSELDEDVKEAIHFVPEVVHTFIKCPKCGSRDFEIVKGRGIAIKEVVFRGS